MTVAQPHPDAARSKAGFTITELVIAAAVFTMGMSIMVSTHVLSLREVGGDSLHIQYIDDARAVEQQIVNLIQAETAIGVSTNGLEVYDQSSIRTFTIRYIDTDGDPTTVDDNLLVADPVLEIDGDETVLCEFVSPIAGEQMFEMAPGSPARARLTFHVGELPPESGMVEYGRNYHGVEVRITAAPRNSNFFLQ